MGYIFGRAESESDLSFRGLGQEYSSRMAAGYSTAPGTRIGTGQSLGGKTTWRLKVRYLFLQYACFRLH